nr:MAG TPA: hypothetical protein [Caudoviricetes sp.]
MIVRSSLIVFSFQALKAIVRKFRTIDIKNLIVFLPLQRCRENGCNNRILLLVIVFHLIDDFSPFGVYQSIYAL